MTVWLLNHICGDSMAGRNSILNSGLFSKVLSKLEEETIPNLVLNQGLWLITSIYKPKCQKNEPDKNTSEKSAKILSVYLKSPNMDTIMDCLWGLNVVTDTSHHSVMQIVLESGTIPLIFKLAVDYADNKGIISCAIKICGNMLTGKDLVIDEMINHGVIPFLERYVNDPFKHFRREAIWALSNIAAGTKSQITALCDSGVLNKIFELVKDSDSDVIREATWVISNCLSGADLELDVKLIRLGILDPILYILACIGEAKTLVITLEALKCLFNQGNQVKALDNNNPFVTHFNNKGGYEYLEKLQVHENMEVYRAVVLLFEKFFNVETIVS